jgi:hypothetical protein
MNIAKVFYFIGISLLILIGLSYLVIGLFTLRTGNVDFPCEYFGPPPTLAKIEENTRIAYCISWYPRDHYGAAPYAYGSSTEDKLTIIPIVSGYTKLILERQGENIIINDYLLKPGDIYRKSYKTISINPWLYKTADLEIMNNGIVNSNNTGQSTTDEALYISGNLKEGWASSMIIWNIGIIGLIVIFLGVSIQIILIIKRKINAAQHAAAADLAKAQKENAGLRL